MNHSHWITNPNWVMQNSSTVESKLGPRNYQGHCASSVHRWLCRRNESQHCSKLDDDYALTPQLRTHQNSEKISEEQYLQEGTCEGTHLQMNLRWYYILSWLRCLVIWLSNLKSCGRSIHDHGWQNPSWKRARREQWILCWERGLREDSTIQSQRNVFNDYKSHGHGDERTLTTQPKFGKAQELELKVEGGLVPVWCMPLDRLKRYSKTLSCIDGPAPVTRMLVNSAGALKCRLGARWWTPELNCNRSGLQVGTCNIHLNNGVGPFVSTVSQRKICTIPCSARRLCSLPGNGILSWFVTTWFFEGYQWKETIAPDGAPWVMVKQPPFMKFWAKCNRTTESL